MSIELYPLGTVVKLRQTDKLMMICGYASVSESNPQAVYDYCGFTYPEGYVDMHKIYQFNNEEIEGLVAMGYQDVETNVCLREFEKQLTEIKTARASDGKEK